MDFLPDKEFHKIFDRISRRVNLEGAGTPAEINRRLNHKISEYEYQYGRDLLGQFQAESRITQLRKLIFAGFGRRAINEAIADPHGKVALTLKYGREKARHILSKRKRKPIV